MASCGVGSGLGCGFSEIWSVTAETFQPFFWPRTTPKAATRTIPVTTAVFFSLVIERHRLKPVLRLLGFSFAQDGQVEIAVRIDDHLLDLGHDLLHGLNVQAMSGHRGCLGVFGFHLIETGGVA